MTKERRFRREIGLLVFGVVLGGIMGIASDLWAAYYVKWLESSVHSYNWALTLIVTSIALILIVGFLLVWSIRQITRG
jgi:H+/Cl- antiporter ClcA